MELAVRVVLGNMSCLWLAVDDEPGANSLRGYIELNSIALLSNWEREPLDSPSAEWIGWYSGRDRVQQSGLWNSAHVDKQYDSAFLHTLERLIDDMR